MWPAEQIKLSLQLNWEQHVHHDDFLLNFKQTEIADILDEFFQMYLENSRPKNGGEPRIDEATRMHKLFRGLKKFTAIFHEISKLRIYPRDENKIQVRPIRTIE